MRKVQHPPIQEKGTTRSPNRHCEKFTTAHLILFRAGGDMTTRKQFIQNNENLSRVATEDALTYLGVQAKALTVPLQPRAFDVLLHYYYYKLELLKRTTKGVRRNYLLLIRRMGGGNPLKKNERRTRYVLLDPLLCSMFSL